MSKGIHVYQRVSYRIEFCLESVTKSAEIFRVEDTNSCEQGEMKVGKSNALKSGSLGYGQGNFSKKIESIGNL